MSRFFIDRPVFAIVLSLLILIAGGAAIAVLPVARYPEIVPPTINIPPPIPAPTPNRGRFGGGPPELSGVKPDLLLHELQQRSVKIVRPEIGTTRTWRRSRCRTAWRSRACPGRWCAASP
jgi:hypothetical protein